MFIDNNGESYFIDNLGVTLWIDDNGIFLGGRQFTISFV